MQEKCEVSDLVLPDIGVSSGKQQDASTGPLGQRGKFSGECERFLALPQQREEFSQRAFYVSEKDLERRGSRTSRVCRQDRRSSGHRRMCSDVLSEVSDRKTRDFRRMAWVTSHDAHAFAPGYSHIPRSLGKGGSRGKARLKPLARVPDVPQENILAVAPNRVIRERYRRVLAKLEPLYVEIKASLERISKLTFSMYDFVSWIPIYQDSSRSFKIAHLVANVLKCQYYYLLKLEALPSCVHFDKSIGDIQKDSIRLRLKQIIDREVLTVRMIFRSQIRLLIPDFFTHESQLKKNSFFLGMRNALGPQVVQDLCHIIVVIFKSDEERES